MLRLEPGVARGVQAVVDEQVHPADLAHERWQPVPAGALQVGPARPAVVGDGGPGLRVQPLVERVRQVDAPQVAPVVAAQPLEHDAAGHAVGDSVSTTTSGWVCSTVHQTARLSETSALLYQP